MKTLVLTAYDDAFAPLGDITTLGKDRYAMRHGYDFRLRRTKPIGLAPLWWKQELVIEALREYEMVLWMDCDVLVTNPYRSIEGLTEGIHLSKDWGQDAITDGHFSCGAYAASHQSLPVFLECESYRNEHPDAPFGDQDALRHVYASGARKELFRIHSRRAFNAVPIEVHPSVVEPWEPGDFLCHITMIPLQDRVRLAREILERI